MSAENDMSSESEDVLKDEFLNETNANDPGVPEEGSSEPTAMESQEEGKERDPKKGISPLFTDFMQHFETESSAEGKIRLSIDFMRAALSNSGTPRFKDFWEGRKICLPLFKENISPKVRSQLWSSYSNCPQKQNVLRRS